ncbi:hypothetical protein [Halothermothrix orenii]|nr:hypothetical protein [Halothermothrix orenii]
MRNGLKNLRSSITIGLVTFLIAILVTLISQSRIRYISLNTAIIVLLSIIFVGIISDMVGVAATAAEEKNFNARAAKKIPGARQGLYLVQHADRVASFMCDIVGDICGTISGAIGAVIVIKLVDRWNLAETFTNLITIGLIASLTVGGKAFFKWYGIKKADEIIFFVGKILAGLSLVKRRVINKIRGDL